MSEPPHPEVVILNVALELRPEERAAFLDQACEGDANLRQQVEALLKAHEQAGGFLSAPPARFDFKRTVLMNVLPAEKPGDKIGHYKLLQQIGEGGCGVVYMAEQEEPVRRRVALKVIKLGMDTKEVIARFEAERQALALMDHPNIAKIFDAGITGIPLTRPSDTLSPSGGEGRDEGAANSQLPTPNSQLSAGRPYFVMELVRGIKITDYCDQNNLSTEERLKLFIQVCQAIQHAHQKGIIHRDIKPSNILVTVNDGVPVPKVIDFGIAKATAGRLTDKTLFTAFDQFIGTPAYMSPEQAVMTSLDIDTRSDIYSLGVLLYELLTGKTPFDADELFQVGLDAMRRIIWEKEPPKPSTRLSTMLDAERTVTASHRHTDPPKLIHMVRGDLDWIVMKALDKDRARRYETANGLAMDIERHLHDKPVIARPPSKLYRFQKSVQRNKLAFAAATAIAAVLMIGVVVSTLEAIRATRAEREQIRQRQIAETKEKKSQQVADFLKKMLEGVGPSVALGRDTTMLREILDKIVDQLDTGLTNQPEVEAELRTTIGQVYEALGEADKAAAMHRRALELRRKALGNSALEVAESLNNLALELHHQSKLDEADAMLQEALSIERKSLGKQEHPLTAESLSMLAYVRLWQNRLEESESLFREALAMRRKLYGNEHLDVADTLNNLALPITARGRLAEAESLLHESLAMKRKLVKQDDEDIAMTLYNLADALQRGKRFEEAAAAFRESLVIRRKVLGDSPGTFITLDRLANVRLELGKLPEAENALLEAHAMRTRLMGINYTETGVWWLRLWDVLERQGKLTNSLVLDALSIVRNLSTNSPSILENSLTQVGSLLGQEKKFAQAETLLRGALLIARQSATNNPSLQDDSLVELAWLLDEQGKAAEAEALIREALANARTSPTNDPAVLEKLLVALQNALRSQNKYAEAETCCREALAIERRAATDNLSLSRLGCRLVDLGNVLSSQNKFIEAEVFLREADAGTHQLTAVDPSHLEDISVELGAVLRGQNRFAEAEVRFRQALATARQFLARNPARLDSRLADLGGVLRAQGKYPEAEILFREAAASARQYATNDPARLQACINDLADVLRRQGKLNEADSAGREGGQVGAERK